MNDWSDEQTADPLYADDLNFYKVEAWSRDGGVWMPCCTLATAWVEHRNFCHDRQASAAHAATRALQQWPQ